MLTWLAGSNTHPPVLLQFRSSKTFIIATVTTAVFTDLFIYAIVVPILPFALESRAHINPSNTKKWISIFLAVYGGALLFAAPICGWVADRTGSRRGPMLFGLIALLGSTVMLCLGRTVAVMVVGRVLQGVSAAIVWGVGLALLVDTMGADGVGLAMGYVCLGMSLATLVAPLLGGIVFAKAGYYAVFAMAFGLIILDVSLRVVMIEKKIAARWLSNVTSIEGAEKPAVVGPCQGGTILNTHNNDVGTGDKEGAQVVVEVHDESLSTETSERITRTKNLTDRLPSFILLLASRRLLSALFCCTTQTIVYTVMDAILPSFVRDTFHWNSLGAGLIFLPLVLGSLLCPIIGHLCDRYGPRWFATIGCIIACPCLILLRLVQHNTLQQKILICGLLAVLSVGLNVVMTPMMAEITYSVEEKASRRPRGFFGKNGAYAQAYGLFNIAWSAGGLIGPLLGGLVNENEGWGAATLLLGCICITTAIPAGIWTGGSIFDKVRAPERSETE